MELRHNVKGPERKALVAAITEILGQEAAYQRGFDTYKIGDYVVDKEGTLTGPDDISLRAWLVQKGFEADVQPDDRVLTTKPDEDASEAGAESAEAGCLTAPTTEPQGYSAEVIAEPATETVAEPTGSGILTIELPMDGFMPEKLDNLRKLVESKASLIKKALGTDELPIIITENGTIGFPWFSPDLDSESITAYSQFLVALCETAKAKTRVTAQEHAFVNEKFSMRVFGIGLGLIGPEYRLIRKLLSQNLSGNSAWSDGVDPRRKPKPEEEAE